MSIFEDEEELKDKGKSDEERKQAADDGLDQPTNLIKDKIFNNNYESTEMEGGLTSFQVKEGHGQSNQSFEERVESDMAYELVSKVLDESSFRNLNKPDSDGNYKKLNKLQINEVYSYVAAYLPNFSRIQIFSVIQEYFDVNSNKFYDSLSNTFKKELIEELRSVGRLEEKTGGPLF